MKLKLFFLLLLFSLNTAFAEDVTPTVTNVENTIPFYSAETQLLTIPKLAVKSGECGYAYSVIMSLAGTADNNLQFITRQIEFLGNIGCEDDLYSLFQNDSRSIYFSAVVVIDEQGAQTTLSGVQLFMMSGDPFGWYYPLN